MIFNFFKTALLKLEYQGQFYSAVDLGELAAELDTMERRRMAEVSVVDILLSSWF